MAPFVMAPAPALAAAPADTGFDQFGYNYQARVFVGPADGVDRNLDGTVWGDPTYAKDHLVMKWSKAWDDARFHGAAWGPGAWVTNEWNGSVPGGSGIGEHCKIVWIGGSGPELERLPDGGYRIWGQFEAILDMYTGPGGNTKFAFASPNGLGGK